MNYQKKFMEFLNTASQKKLIQFAGEYWNQRGISNALFYFICDSWVEGCKDNDIEAMKCLSIIRKLK